MQAQIDCLQGQLERVLPGRANGGQFALGMLFGCGLQSLVDWNAGYFRWKYTERMPLSHIDEGNDPAIAVLAFQNGWGVRFSSDFAVSDNHEIVHIIRGRLTWENRAIFVVAVWSSSTAVFSKLCDVGRYEIVETMGNGGTQNCHIRN